MIKYEYLKFGGSMRGLTSFVQLRRLLLEMEKDLGLGEVSKIEKNVLVACAEVHMFFGESEFSIIINHDLLLEENASKIKQALKKLVERNLISVSDKTGKKIYQVQSLA